MLYRNRLGLLGLASLCAGPGLAAQDANERVAAALEARRAELTELRRDLHRHPELSGQEERTAAVVAEELRALGLAVRTGVGGHGVVAVLRSGDAGPVVAFRADMDAVRSGEHDPVAFRSETPGVRHICGHDVHTTVGVATAHALHAVRDAWAGSVVFLFQPAEETGRGARAMLAEGVLEDPRPAAIFAFHCAPAAVGTIAATPGRALPQRDDLRVTLRGTGDLSEAARVVGSIVTGATTLAAGDLGRLVTEDYALARVFGSAGAGPEQWIVNGQVTASGPGSSAAAREAIQRGLSEAAFEDVACELTYDAAIISGIDNDPALLEATAPVIRSILGADGLRISHGSTPGFSEDFGFFQARVPGVMYWLGVSNPELGTVGMPHSPDFVADEEAIFVGARAMAAVLLSRLEPR